MALDFHLEFYVEGNPDPLLKLSPSWWKIDDIQNKFSFRQSQRSLGIDKSVQISVEELLDLHVLQLKYKSRPLYENPDWKKLIDTQQRELEKILKDAIHFDRILIRVFEWDSGY